MSNVQLENGKLINLVVYEETTSEGKKVLTVAIHADGSFVYGRLVGNFAYFYSVNSASIKSAPVALEPGWRFATEEDAAALYDYQRPELLYFE